ncbi:DoxX family protein [Agromyces marinus]|uniref:DoxX family protein n=1 Tax=Agromyces marinus TaxID=1389020 RepID=A0ABN6YIY3_9MICO|nr:DoxX family protein [Agromyces marinus]UIP59041.1 hypothetical protein DSM26151_19350 [Agromyces marinus]BDZ55981.1 hypothetical protein GCM10025870_30540 [Agromyces marinus]
MLIALWILNALLALAFLAAGAMKAIRPKEALAGAGMAWTEDFSSPSVKLIGAAEVVGAFGLILPLATGIAPILSPIAAAALTVVMIAAAVVHVRRGESAVPAIVLAGLSAVSTVLGLIVLS